MQALRTAVRQSDDAKVALLIDFLLKQVPLQWVSNEEVGEQGDDFALVTISIIRGTGDGVDDNGLAFETHEKTHIVHTIRRADEVPALAIGDRVVLVDHEPLDRPLLAAVAPESVCTLGVWKRAAMATLRAKLARNTLCDALVETARYAEHEPAACAITARLLRARVSLAYCDERHFTALHWAAHRGQLALCELLLEAGAPLEGKSRKVAAHTPLQLAVMGAHGAVVRLLLAARAAFYGLPLTLH